MSGTKSTRKRTRLGATRTVTPCRARVSRSDRTRWSVLSFRFSTVDRRPNARRMFSPEIIYLSNYATETTAVPGSLPNSLVDAFSLCPRTANTPPPRTRGYTPNEVSSAERFCPVRVCVFRSVCVCVCASASVHVPVCAASGSVHNSLCACLCIRECVCVCSRLC